MREVSKISRVSGINVNVKHLLTFKIRKLIDNKKITNKILAIKIKIINMLQYKQ
jgi:hypothetical protein